MASRRRTGGPDLGSLEPSEVARQPKPSDLDAMGQDKRRQVVGHSYGPSRRSQVMFFVTVAAVLVVIVGGWLALVSIFDKPPIHFKDTAPWSKTASSLRLAAEQRVKPVEPSSPCGEPGRQYPVPPQSPCAAPSAANDNQGVNGGSPSNVSPATTASAGQ